MSLVKNSSIVAVSVLISSVLAYIFHIVVARSLGPAEYGVFGALFSLLTILMLPSSTIAFSITKFTARLHGEEKRKEIGVLRHRVFKRVVLYGILMFILLFLTRDLIISYLKIDSSIEIMLV